MSHYVPQPPARIISHYYPTEESYQWRFTGGWGAESPAPMPTDNTEFRDKSVPYDVRLTGDHVAWHLPGFIDAVRAEPECIARVEGHAGFEKRGPHSNSPKQALSEDVSGTLTIMVETW